jgi:hypothetical protein
VVELAEHHQHGALLFEAREAVGEEPLVERRRARLLREVGELLERGDELVLGLVRAFACAWVSMSLRRGSGLQHLDEVRRCGARARRGEARRRGPAALR